MSESAASGSRTGRRTTPPEDATLPEVHRDAPPPGTVIAGHWSECALCGIGMPLRMDLRFRVGDGLSVVTDFVVSGLHQGAPGLAHGGLLTAALDEALGYLNWLVGAPAVTARVEVDFRRPVPVGSRMFVTAEVTGVLDRKVFGRAVGRLDAPDGPVAIAASSLFVQVDHDHFIEHGGGIDMDRAIAEREERRRRYARRDFEVNP